eukprot:1572097-Amphidinium_carterae.2
MIRTSERCVFLSGMAAGSLSKKAKPEKPKCGLKPPWRCEFSGFVAVHVLFGNSVILSLQGPNCLEAHGARASLLMHVADSVKAANPEIGQPQQISEFALNRNGP